MGAIVGKQGGSVGSSGTPAVLVALIEPFNEGSAQAVLPSCITEDSYLWTNL